VNCQLYTGWPLGKRKPGIVSDGEGLIEAAGASIEVRGVGLSYRVWVKAPEGDGGSVVHLCNETFWEEHQEHVGPWSKLVLNALSPPRGIVVPVVHLVHSDPF